MAEIHIERVASTDLAEVIQLFTEQVYPNHPEEAHRHFAGHTEGQADTFLASVAGELAISPSVGTRRTRSFVSTTSR
jgi:hypothetical protein